MTPFDTLRSENRPTTISTMMASVRFLDAMVMWCDRGRIPAGCLNLAWGGGLSLCLRSPDTTKGENSMNIENEVEELKRKVRDLEDEIKKVRHTAEEPLDVTRLAARLSDAV